MLRKIRSLFILAGAVLASSMIPGGCPFLSDPNAYQLVDPYEPDTSKKTNNTFDTASIVDLSKDKATISNAVLTLGDVDVYNLGAFKIGDQLAVDMTTPKRVLLNASVAIFDSTGRLFYLTQESENIASKPVTDIKFPAFTPQFNFTVKQATDPLYLAVASQTQDLTGSGDYAGLTGGPYSINLTVRRSTTSDPLPTQSQVVALQFDSSTVQYPPLSVFGQLTDSSAFPLTGMNGAVLDPAWWRSFMILRTAMDTHKNDAAFWTNFLTFAGTINQGLVGQTTAAQVYGLLNGEFKQAIPKAAADPGNFTPSNILWFGNNKFPWLYLLAQYLGPPPAGATATYLNQWETILPGMYPATLDSRYSDAATIAATVKAKMQAAYTGLNVDFRIVGTDPLPTDEPVSTIYFVSNATTGTPFGDPNGGFVYGLGSNIDMGNSDRTDFAAIWAGEIGYSNALALAGGNADSLQTPADSMDFVGAVGSHELGHILGLVHTNQSGDIMNSQADFQASRTAVFSNAPLSSGMFPIGTQDSYLLLLLELGLAP